jgi:hypothetical protein
MAVSVMQHKTADLQLLVDAALLLSAAVGVVDGKWNAKEAKAPMKMFERVVATSRSTLVREALFYFHDRERVWMGLSMKNPIVAEVTGLLLPASAAQMGTAYLAVTAYGPLADAAGTMLRPYPLEERQRAISMIWMVGLATAEADGPLFGRKASDEELAVLDKCVQRIAKAAGTTLEDAIAFVEQNLG